MKILIESQCWGKEYAEIFLKEVFPIAKQALIILNENNRHEISFHFYLDDDAKNILYAHLDEIKNPIIIHNIGDVSKSTFVYEREADCKYHCMCNAVANDAAVIFLDTNQVFSPYNWRAFIRRIEEGYDAVVMKSPRILYPCEKVIFNSNRDMVKFMLENLHPLEWNWFTDKVYKERYMNTPCSFYLRTSGGMYCRGLHMAIPCVKPRSKGSRGGFSPDHCYHTGFGLDKIYVVPHSDEACAFELCRKDFGNDGNSHFDTVESFNERFRQVLTMSAWTKRNLVNCLTPIQLVHNIEINDYETMSKFLNDTEEMIKTELAHR